MRLSGPLYEGDSLLHPIGGFGPDVEDTRADAATTARIPQRSKDVPEVAAGLDTFEVEARARALRAEAIRAGLVAAWHRIDEWFARLEQRRTEAYLARSQNLADLENRLRQLERNGQIAHL